MTQEFMVLQSWFLSEMGIERLRPHVMDIRENVPLAAFTTFNIGGPAEYLVTPKKEEELSAVLGFCHEEGIKPYIIGNGSNLLISDKGLKGITICMRGFDADIAADENGSALAGAGISLRKFATTMAKNGFTGFEFAAGIPGSFGGALVMNAGAYEGEMSQIVTGVRVMDTEGHAYNLYEGDFGYGYRTSRMLREGLLVIAGSIKLDNGDADAAMAKISELNARRREKQPLEFPSAGSAFKRPEGYFAGKLIMDAGLKGFRIGGAQVSEKHCGFIVNTGFATAADVKNLIGEVQAKVLDKFGVALEPEIRILGEF